MKNYAQAILLFTGYPLEPIVALQLNKSLQSHATDSASTAQSAGTKKRAGRSGKLGNKRNNGGTPTA